MGLSVSDGALRTPRILMDSCGFVWTPMGACGRGGNYLFLEYWCGITQAVRMGCVIRSWATHQDSRKEIITLIISNKELVSQGGRTQQGNPLDFYGSPLVFKCIPSDSYGFLWIPKVSHGSPWNPIVLWIPLDSC